MGKVKNMNQRPPQTRRFPFTDTVHILLQTKNKYRFTCKGTLEFQNVLINIHDESDFISSFALLYDKHQTHVYFEESVFYLIS